MASPLKTGLKKSAQWLASRLGPQRFAFADSRLWVLMYHRILPATDPRTAAEEPGMIVTPETFRQHLRDVKRLFTVVKLSEWVRRRAAGETLPHRTCAITFDDGWLDNYQFALPILKEEQVPATLFAVSDMIGTHREFWPNRLARLLARNQNDRAHPALAWLREVDGTNGSGPLDRNAIARIIDACKRLPDDLIATRLDEAERVLDIDGAAAPSLVSWEQLREMQNSGLFEIGSHTCNHYRLVDGLDPKIAASEISESKRRLERQLDRPVALFCYPNGDASPAAVALVREHYSAAVTTARGINRNGIDRYGLKRIGVHEDISATSTSFEARLSGWM